MRNKYDSRNKNMFKTYRNLLHEIMQSKSNLLKNTEKKYIGLLRCQNKFKVEYVRSTQSQLQSQSQLLTRNTSLI